MRRLGLGLLTLVMACAREPEAAPARSPAAKTASPAFEGAATSRRSASDTRARPESTDAAVQQLTQRLVQEIARETEAAKPKAPSLEALAGLPEVQTNARHFFAANPSGASRLQAVHVLDAVPAAVIRYEVGDAQTVLEPLRFLLVGSGPMATKVLTPPGAPPCGDFSGVFDLRGDGRLALVFNEWGGGYHCVTGDELAYELVSGQWQQMNPSPQHPTQLADVNRDGTPDFPVQYSTVEMGDCLWSTCGDYTWTPKVLLYETWTGDGKLSMAPQRFEARYRELFDDLVRLANSSASRSDGFCSMQSLEIAVGIYVYGMLLGEPEPKLFVLADRVMRGQLTKPCTEMGQAPTLTWKQARQKLHTRAVELRRLRQHGRLR